MAVAAAATVAVAVTVMLCISLFSKLRLFFIMLLQFQTRRCKSNQLDAIQYSIVAKQIAGNRFCAQLLDRNALPNRNDCNQITCEIIRQHH